MSAAPASRNPFAQSLDVTRVLTQSPPSFDEVLPGLLAGTVGAIVAPGGLGKTMLLLQTSVGLASGTPVCDGLFQSAAPPLPQKVVVVCAEESRDVLAHRLHAIALTLAKLPAAARRDCLAALDQNLHLVGLDGDPEVALVSAELEATQAVEHLLTVCEGARLVVLDPLRQFHLGDENSSLVMNRVVQVLRHVAGRTGAAVIVAHHANRASSVEGLGDSAGAARGSTALTDGVRWQLNLWKPTPAMLEAHDVRPTEAYRHVALSYAKTNHLARTGYASLLCRQAGGVLSLVPPPRSADARAQKRAVR